MAEQGFDSWAADLLASPAVLELGRAQGFSADSGHIDMIFGRRAPKEVVPRLFSFLGEQDERARALPFEEGARVHERGWVIRIRWMSKKRIVVVTGLAGAGKSTAARALEDLGFFVVDNLPPQLIETLVTLSDSSGGELWRMAFVIDAREAKFLKDFGPTWERLKALGHEVTLLFLDASDEALLTRFQETRRRHPLAGDDGVREGIAKERELLEEMQQRADHIIDTSDLSVHDLKRLISERFEAAGLEQRRVTVMSFGFKHGLPHELDLCFDVRFLHNPYFVEALRPLPGTDPKVAAYVLKQPDAQAFLEKAEEMLCFLLPRFAQEGKAYITAAIGCTGGKHRSVAIAEALGQRMKARGLDVRVVHRDVAKP